MKNYIIFNLYTLSIKLINFIGDKYTISISISGKHVKIKPMCSIKTFERTIDFFYCYFILFKIFFQSIYR